MRIRIANAPVSWGVMEIEGWEPPLHYTDFLDELTKAGYEGTELGPYGYMSTDPEELGRQLRSRSQELISAFVPLRLKEPESDLEPAREAGRLLGALGARHMVIADALWPEREAVAGRVEQNDVRLAEAEWEQVAENIGAVCRVAGEFGLRCVFHHHAGTYIETPAEVKRLVELTDIGLCLDTGHYVYGGGDPVDAVRALGKRVEYLHFKDVNLERLQAARRDRLGFVGGVRAGVFCELGTGCVRFPDLLRELDSAGYDGWAVVEQDIDPRDPSATPLESAIASRKYLREILGI
jgi:inosose dehydratase